MKELTIALNYTSHKHIHGVRPLNTIKNVSGLQLSLQATDRNQVRILYVMQKEYCWGKISELPESLFCDVSWTPFVTKTMCIITWRGVYHTIFPFSSSTLAPHQTVNAMSMSWVVIGQSSIIPGCSTSFRSLMKGYASPAQTFPASWALVSCFWWKVMYCPPPLKES